MEAKSRTEENLKQFARDFTKFSLDQEFINFYRGKEPKWSIEEYEIYMLYYTRYIVEENRKEDFWEALKRVVEECFDVQRNFYLKFKSNPRNLNREDKITWDEQEAQALAQLMFVKIWNLKSLDAVRYLLKLYSKYRILKLVKTKLHRQILLNDFFINFDD
jgi:hypothetical protein